MTASVRPKLVLCLVVACLLTFAACGGGSGGGSAGSTPAPTAQTSVWPGADWDVSSPESEGMDAAGLEDVATYCQAHNCGGVVIVRHGRIVWERYRGGWDVNSTDNSWSMAKSVTSALVGIAIAEGKIKSIDESAADFIPEWRGDDRKEITLRNLLSMTSGLLWNEDYFQKSDVTTMIFSDDQNAYAISRPLSRDPGDDWYYSSGDAQVFSAIIKAATGEDAYQYAQEKLLGPIGVTGDWWDTDKAGNVLTYCCLHTTAREFARFGYLYLRDGLWGDKQIVPADWVRESTQASQSENPSYGLYWWLLDLPDAPKDTYMAMGFQTKRIYVIPSLDIVAVRIGEGDDETWNDDAFLKPIVDAASAQ
jgi:CubicO group peptidase (beta-lactamase class C family)